MRHYRFSSDSFSLSRGNCVNKAHWFSYTYNMFAVRAFLPHDNDDTRRYKTSKLAGTRIFSPYPLLKQLLLAPLAGRLWFTVILYTIPSRVSRKKGCEVTTRSSFVYSAVRV